MVVVYLLLPVVVEELLEPVYIEIALEFCLFSDCFVSKIVRFVHFFGKLEQDDCHVSEQRFLCEILLGVQIDEQGNRSV